MNIPHYQLLLGGVRTVADIPLAAISFTTEGTFTKSFFKKLKNGETSQEWLNH